MKDEQNIKIESLKQSELITGIQIENDCYRCVVCGAEWHDGEIYPTGDRFLEARRAVSEHVEVHHGGMLTVLLDLPKQVSGLTDIQRQLLQQLALRRTDKEIARTLGGKAESTIRNHRFQLKKRVNEARVLVAVSELLEQKETIPMTFITYHSDIPTSDDRIMTTQAEADQILKRCLESSNALILKRFPKKEKEKLVILKRITEELSPEYRYTEKELNAILKPIYADYVTIRRYLIEYRFMKRKPDCSEYWLNV